MLKRYIYLTLPISCVWLFKLCNCTSKIILRCIRVFVFLICNKRRVYRPIRCEVFKMEAMGKVQEM